MEYTLMQNASLEYSLMQNASLSGGQGTATPPVLLVTSEGVGGANDSAPFFNPDNSPAYFVMRRLQTVLIPIICVLGIFGNVLAAGTFLSPGLNKTSCCFHLASKSLNDICFLVSLFIVWLFRMRVPLLTTPGVCQVTVFLHYVCGCMSVWFVVGITTENFIRFTQPRLVQRYCNVVMAKRLVLGITAVSSLFYNFALWTSGVSSDAQGSRACVSLQQFQAIVMAMTFIDTALTLIVPTIIMFFLILAIVFKSMESFERKKRLRSSSSSTSSSGPQRGPQKKRMTPEGKMTTFLFAISIIFLALNLPYHSIRLKLLIQVYILGVAPPSYSDMILQRVFEIFLYFNFSTNCLIYLVCGERFRAVFVAKYLQRCSSRPSRGTCSYTERSDGSPILLTQRTSLGDNDESLCLTCVPSELSDGAALTYCTTNGTSC